MYLLVWLFLQIILEFLPVSSSGHLELLSKFFGTMPTNIETWYQLIQLPTLFLLFCFYFQNIIWFIHTISRTYIIALKIMGLAFIVDSITFLFYVPIKVYGFFTIPLWLGFLCTGFLLYSLTWCPEKNKSWNIGIACILGIVQGISLLPGISRLASTFVIARWLGISSRRAFEISWLIEVPLIGAAWLLTCLKITYHHAWGNYLDFSIFIGIFLSCIIAWYVLKFCSWLVNHNDLSWLAWYMIIPTILALL